MQKTKHPFGGSSCEAKLKLMHSPARPTLRLLELFLVLVPLLIFYVVGLYYFCLAVLKAGAVDVIRLGGTRNLPHAIGPTCTTWNQVGQLLDLFVWVCAVPAFVR